MSVNGILVGQKKDTSTILSIKQDTTDILAKLNQDTSDGKRYGFRIKKNEPNSADRVEYILDAVNMTPITMNLETGAINYGSWADVWFIRNNLPYMVKYNGVVDYQLSPTDYSKKADGVSDSDYANPNYGGDAMAAIPLCWVKRYEDDVYEYFIVCEKQYDDTYKAYAHTSVDGTIKDVAYHAMYEGSLIDGKLRSLAGQTPSNSTTTANERSYAKSGRTGNWDIKYWSLHALIADLLTLISKNDNSQAAFGDGNSQGQIENNKTSNNTSFNITGTVFSTPGTDTYDTISDDNKMFNKGAFYGVSTVTANGNHVNSMKVFHIENFWADRWDRCLGMILYGNDMYVKMTPEGNGYQHGTSISAYSEYEKIPSMVPTNTKGTGAYQKDNVMTRFGRLPTLPFTGSDSTYTGDYFYYNTSSIRLALLGGACYGASLCGSRFLDLNFAPTATSWVVGASLTLV